MWLSRQRVEHSALFFVPFPKQNDPRVPPPFCSLVELQNKYTGHTGSIVRRIHTPRVPHVSGASRRRGGEGKKRGRPPAVKDEHMSPLSPSKVSEMRKNKKFKLMEKGQKCLVWDEETAAFKTRRERGLVPVAYFFFAAVVVEKAWVWGRGWGCFVCFLGGCD